VKFFIDFATKTDFLHQNPFPKAIISSLYHKILVLYQLTRMIFLFFSFATLKIGFICLLMRKSSYRYYISKTVTRIWNPIELYIPK
jgi:hypothetical protein